MKKTRVKWLVDLTLGVLTVALSAYAYTGTKAHSVLGTAALAVFLAHTGLNLRWYRSLIRGAYPVTRILSVVVNAALLASTLGAFASGLQTSGWLELGIDLDVARRMHMSLSWLTILLVGAHLGLHFDVMTGALRRKFPALSRKFARWSTLAFAVAVSGYGVHALLKMKILTFVALRTGFAFFDYETPVALWLVDVLAVTTLMGTLGYGVKSLCRRVDASRRRKSADV